MGKKGRGAGAKGCWWSSSTCFTALVQPGLVQRRQSLAGRRKTCCLLAHILDSRYMYVCRCPSLNCRRYVCLGFLSPSAVVGKSLSSFAYISRTRRTEDVCLNGCQGLACMCAYTWMLDTLYQASRQSLLACVACVACLHACMCASTACRARVCFHCLPCSRRW